jgi:hypothetical protein
MVKKPEENGVLGKSDTVAHMVREALEKEGWKAKPDVYREYIFKTFGKDVPKNQISQYKSAEKRKKGMKRRGKISSASTQGPEANNHDDVDEIIEFIADLQHWESRLGAARIKQIVLKFFKSA